MQSRGYIVEAERLPSIGQCRAHGRGVIPKPSDAKNLGGALGSVRKFLPFTGGFFVCLGEVDVVDERSGAVAIPGFPWPNIGAVHRRQGINDGGIRSEVVGDDRPPELPIVDGTRVSFNGRKGVCKIEPENLGRLRHPRVFEKLCQRFIRAPGVSRNEFPSGAATQQPGFSGVGWARWKCHPFLSLRMPVGVAHPAFPGRPGSFFLRGACVDGEACVDSRQSFPDAKNARSLPYLEGNQIKKLLTKPLGHSRHSY